MADMTLPAVPLFQRAHSRILTLHRLDEQLAQLLQQRTKIQEELHSIQSQINSEFERITKMDEDAPAKILETISEIAKGNQVRPNELPSATPTPAPAPTETPARARRVMVAENA